MKLEKQLLDWLDAGIIDGDIKARILAHEAQRSKSKFLYVIFGLASIAIGIGLISLVAANWSHISSGTKVGLNLALGVALCWGLHRADRQHDAMYREILIAVLSLWTLASIALVGQIYQLGGKSESALLFWAIITSPLLAQGQGRLTAILWLVELILVVGAWLKHPEEVLVYAPTLLWCLLCISLSEKTKSLRPIASQTFAQFFICCLAIISNLGTLAFYESHKVNKQLGSELIFSSITAIPFVALAILQVHRLGPSYRFWQYCIGVAFLLQTPVWLLDIKDLDAIGALAFLTLWGLTAKAALDTQMTVLFRMATSLLAMRLIIIYFELFGSLLDTGLLMVTGGVVSILVTHFWHRKSKAMLTGSTDGELS